MFNIDAVPPEVTPDVTQTSSESDDVEKLQKKRKKGKEEEVEENVGGGCFHDEHPRPQKERSVVVGHLAHLSSKTYWVTTADTNT